MRKFKTNIIQKGQPKEVNMNQTFFDSNFNTQIKQTNITMDSSLLQTQTQFSQMYEKFKRASTNKRQQDHQGLTLNSKPLTQAKIFADQNQSFMIENRKDLALKSSEKQRPNVSMIDQG